MRFFKLKIMTIVVFVIVIQRIFHPKSLLCLYDKQNNTWLLLDMEFFFLCST